MLGLRDSLARYLLDRGVRQWKPGELTAEWIEERIAAGSVYVVSRDTQLIGSVTITREDTSIWGKRDDLAGYIHLLMIDRAFTGYGVGRSLLAWSEATIEADDRGLARLDCVRSNDRLRRYYEEVGYRLVGYRDFLEVPWALETALYEKRLGRTDRASQSRLGRTGWECLAPCERSATADGADAFAERSRWPAAVEHPEL